MSLKTVIDGMADLTIECSLRLIDNITVNLSTARQILENCFFEESLKLINNRFDEGKIDQSEFEALQSYLLNKCFEINKLNGGLNVTQ